MSVIADVDYVVVGAGASGLAFTDSLIHHSDARVLIVDRREDAGGHWRDAYPFVRLHQASQFYGVASTLLGGGRLQSTGPEAGLQERATGSEVVAYFENVLRRLRATDRVAFLAHHELVEGHGIRDLASGEVAGVPAHATVVDARYLSPRTPADTPPPFVVGDDARVAPIASLPDYAGTAERYVITGSGKTATDAIVWLLQEGTDPDRICWVRPREPWMLDRAVIQPDPAIYQGMVADLYEASNTAGSVDDLFERLEGVGIAMRIDPTLTPTMAKGPTLGRWELDLLRTVEDVVHAGHIREVGGGVMRLDRSDVRLSEDTLVVHCAGDGLRRPGLVPVWGEARIVLQPIRAGFPCFGAALTGYVEATRPDDRVLKNALCPPSPLGNLPVDWVDMMARGARSTAAFMAEPDIAEWAHSVALNPARLPPEGTRGAALEAALDRVARAAPTAIDRMESLVAGA